MEKCTNVLTPGFAKGSSDHPTVPMHSIVTTLRITYITLVTAQHKILWPSILPLSQDVLDHPNQGITESLA